MEEKITICKCGFVEDNHMFRHDFEPLIQVEIKKIDDKYIFVFDSIGFPTNTKTVCSYPNCSGSKKMHSWNTQHNFEPKEINFREIRLCVPNSVLQMYEKDCIEKIRKNETGNTFSDSIGYKNIFTSSSCFGLIVYLNIKNLNPNDKISVFNEEDDEIKYELISS